MAIIAIFPMVFARGVGGEILAPMPLPVLDGQLMSDEVVDLFLPFGSIGSTGPGG